MILESRFLKKYYIFTILIFFPERFDQLKKNKIWIPYCVFNLAWPMGGGNFRDIIIVIQSFSYIFT